MFGKLINLVLGHLNKVLIDWIEPISKEQINLKSILAGKADIKHLQIRQKVMNLIPVPFNLVFNYIGHVYVNIPIYALFARPVVIEIKDVLMVVSTKPLHQWNPEFIKEQFMRMKTASLLGQETSAYINTFENGILWRMAMRLAKHIKINIQNIQIRIEDHVCRQSKMMALGVVIKNVDLNGGDFTDIAETIEVSDQLNLLVKKIKIQGLGIYVEDMNTSIPQGTDLLTPYCPRSLIDNEKKDVNEQNEKTKLSNAMSTKHVDNKKLDEEEISVNNNRPSWLKRCFGQTVDTVVTEDDDEEDFELGSLDQKKACELDGGRGGRGRKRRRGWYSEFDDAQPKVYSFDGRVSWRRLLAPYCRRRLYDRNLFEWVDDPTDTDTGFVQDHRIWTFWRSSDTNSRILQQENFYLRTDAEGHMIPTEKELPDESEDRKETVFLASHLNDIENEAVLLNEAPDGSQPSLRLKYQYLDHFLNAAHKMSDAYHSYILEPRSIDILLTACVIPMVPLKHPRRCWSDWGESRRSNEELSEPLPLVRLDITIPDLKIKINDTQILNIFKWAEYSLILNNHWRMGLQSQMEFPVPSDEEKSKYLKLWPIKLLKGQEAPEEVKEWCESFEMRYNIQSISLLRRKIVSSLKRAEHEDYQQSPKAIPTAPGTDDDQTAAPYPPQTVDKGEAFDVGYNFEPGEFGVSHDGQKNREKGPVRFFSMAEENEPNPFETMLESPLGEASETAANSIRQLIDESKLDADTSKLRGLTYSTTAVVDLILVDFSVNYYCEGYGIGVAEDRFGERRLTLQGSALHLHVEARSPSQEINLDIELYPMTALNISRHLDDPQIPPAVSPIFISAFTTDSDIISCRRRRPEESRRFSWRGVEKKKVHGYIDAIESYKSVEPGIYVRLDLQTFKTIERPALRVAVRATAELIVFVVAQQLLQMLKEALSSINIATTNELAGGVGAAVNSCVEAGAEFAQALTKGEIEHTAIEAYVEMQKPLRVVLPRFGTTLDCEGVVLDLGIVKLQSQLAPQLLHYTDRLSKEALYDVYKMEMQGVQLRRMACCTDLIRRLLIFTGGLDLTPAAETIAVSNELEQDHRRRSIHAAVIAQYLQSESVFTGQDKDRADNCSSLQNFATAASMKLMDFDKATSEKRKRRKRERQEAIISARRLVCEHSSYLISLVSTETILIEVCHLKASRQHPALHVDFVQERLQINLCDADIQFFFGLASDSLEILYTFIDELENISIRLTEERTRNVTATELTLNPDQLLSIADESQLGDNSASDSAMRSKKYQRSSLDRVIDHSGIRFGPTEIERKKLNVYETLEQVAEVKNETSNFLGVSDNKKSLEDRNKVKTLLVERGVEKQEKDKEKQLEEAMAFLSREEKSSLLRLHFGIRTINIQVFRHEHQNEERRVQLPDQLSDHDTIASCYQQPITPQMSPIKKEFAFWPTQTLDPLISITMNSVGAIVQNSSAGIIEMKAGVSHLTIQEMCNISPACFSSLYDSTTSFTPTKRPFTKSQSRASITIIIKFTKKFFGFHDVFISETEAPVKDLHAMFQTLNIETNLGTVKCPAAEIAMEKGHIEMYYYMNTNKCEQQIVTRISTFRSIVLWEFLDELFCWCVDLRTELGSLPQRKSNSLIPPAAVQIREQQQLLQTAEEWKAQMLVNRDVSQKSAPIESAGLESEAAKKILSKERKPVSDLGYVLRPGIKIGLMISPFEIIVPSEPVRVPFREYRMSSDKNIKGPQSTSKGSGRFGTSFGKANESKKRKASILWNKLRSMTILRHNEDRSIKLPACIALRGALELKSTVFFYVPDPEIQAVEIEPTPWLIDAAKFVRRGDETAKELSTIESNSTGKDMNLYKDNFGSEVYTREVFGGGLPSYEDQLKWLHGGNDGIFEEVEIFMGPNPNSLLALLCPCLIKFGLVFGQLMLTTVVPSADSPLGRSKIDWPTIIRDNLAFVSPMRLEIDSDIFLPSVRCVYERLHGITPEVANTIRRSRGLFVSKYPEGIEAMINCEPVVLNIDSESCVALYQLLSIIDGFSKYASEKLPKYDRSMDDAASFGCTLGEKEMEVELERLETTEFLQQEPASFTLNLIRTFSVECGVSLDIIRFRLWDTLGAQKRCCLSFDIENLNFLAAASPERIASPHMEEYWWNAFNPPQAVFHCSFLSKLIDEPFDLTKLENPFARQKRKAKGFFSRAWTNSCSGATKCAQKVVNLFRKPKTKEERQEDEVQRDIDEQVTETEKAETTEAQMKEQQKRKMINREVEESAQFLSLQAAQHVAKSASPWLSMKASLEISADYLNRSEKTNYTVLEPFNISVFATKSSIDLPTSVSVEASWVNININVALIDAFLVYAFSVVEFGLRQREKLHLDVLEQFLHHRYGTPNISSIDELAQDKEDILQSSTTMRKSPTRRANKIGDSSAASQPDEADSVIDQPQSYKLLHSSAVLEAMKIGRIVFFLRPTDRFDLLNCLAGAIDRSIIGDAIISKSSSFLNPAAGFSGDHLQSAIPKDSEIATQLRDGVIGQLMDAKDKAAYEARQSPQLFNLLGQPIAIHSRPAKTLPDTPKFSMLEGAEHKSSTWTVLQHTEKTSLALEEGGRTLPFFIRLKLCDCLFDIPSSCLKLDQESLEVITLSFEDPAVDQQKKRSKSGDIENFVAKVAKGFATASGDLKKNSNDLSKYSEGRTTHIKSPSQQRQAHYKNLKGHSSRQSYATTRQQQFDSKRNLWNCNELPEKRRLLKIMIRTGQRITQGDRACYDIFVSSTISIRNNTCLGLQLFPTVPGPLETEPISSPLSIYHKCPSEPELHFSIDHNIYNTYRKYKEIGRPSHKSVVIHASYKVSQNGEKADNNPHLQVISPSNLDQQTRQNKSEKNNSSQENSEVKHLQQKNELTRKETSDENPATAVVYGTTLSYLDVHQNIDVISLDPFDKRVRSIPLFWLLCSNGALWTAQQQEKLFNKGDLRLLLDEYQRADLLLHTDIVNECVELHTQNKRRHELLNLFPPRLIHLLNDKGTLLGISCSIVLISSKIAKNTGVAVEIHLDHCFEISNRLPRTIQIKRVGGLHLFSGARGDAETIPLPSGLFVNRKQRKIDDGKKNKLNVSIPENSFSSEDVSKMQSIENIEDEPDVVGQDVNQEIMTLQPGEDLTLPIHPNSFILYLDGFCSKPINIEYDRREDRLNHVTLSRLNKLPTTTISERLKSNSENIANNSLDGETEISTEELDRQQFESQSGLENFRIAIEQTSILNTKKRIQRTEVTHQSMDTLVSSYTIFSDAWLVNRLSYPVVLNRFDFNGRIFIPGHTRSILPADFSNNQLSISIEVRHFNHIHSFDRYPTKSQGWFFGFQLAAAQSEEFRVSDLATLPVEAKKTATHPLLRYVTCMYSAPTPFMRTTLVELLPQFVVSNERQIPLWIRESVCCGISSIGKTKTNMVAYIPVPPRTAVEFHPQLNRKEIHIQISGLPVVEEYFNKVIRPLIKTYQSSYSFQSFNFNKDSIWWSPSIDVSHAVVCQLRHPCVPTSLGQTCLFSLTEIEVTLRNGVYFIRLLDPNVPEYRLVNLTESCLAIGQHENDFFEAIRPLTLQHRQTISALSRQKRGVGVPLQENDVQERHAQEMLDRLSLPFSWYHPNGVRRLCVWAVTEEARRRRSDTDDNESQNERENDVVTDARKRVASHAEGLGENEYQEENAAARGPSFLVESKQIRKWGAAREYPGYVKLLDIDQLFNELRLRRHKKPRSTVLLLLKPWTSLSETQESQKKVNTSKSSLTNFIPILARLRVIAGSKIIFFDTYRGMIPKSMQKGGIASVKQRMTAVGKLAVGRIGGLATRPTINEVIDDSIRKTIINLWIKGQTDDDLLNDLSVVLRHNHIAVLQLATVWNVGSKESKYKLNAILKANGVSLDLDSIAKDIEIGDTENDEDEGTSIRRKSEDQKSLNQGVADQAGPVKLSAVAVPNLRFNQRILSRIDFEGLGLSLIDHIPSEFLYSTISNLVISADLKLEEIMLKVTIGWLQIDNPSETAYYPTVLRPMQQIALAAGSQSESQWFDQIYYLLFSVLRILVSNSNNLLLQYTFVLGSSEDYQLLDIEIHHKIPPPLSLNERALVEIPKIASFLKPLSINIDLQMLTSFLKFVDDILTMMNVEILSQSIRDIQKSENEPGTPEWKRLLGTELASYRHVSLIISTHAFRCSGYKCHDCFFTGHPIHLLETTNPVNRIYISSFQLGKLAFIVNVRLGRQGNQLSEEPPKTEFIRAILSTLNVRASISDAHLVLSEREQKDICGPVDRLVEEIILSYVGNAVGQLHKVLGAIDLLGNPAMVVKHISSGVEKGAIEFRHGCCTSTKVETTAMSCGRSLCHVLNGCCAGVFDFHTRCFGSWYNLIDMLARNTDQYSFAPDLIKQGGLLDQPRNCCEGTWVGCKSCFLNLGLSVVNIAYKPFKGARLGLIEGADYDTRAQKCQICCKSFSFGCLSGLLSTFGIPSSFLLCGQFVTAGVLNQISSIPMLLSVRPRRVFHDGTSKLKSFSMGHALSIQKLKQLPETTDVANIDIVISLDSPNLKLSFYDQIKRKLKLTNFNEGLDNFIGLGSRRLGLFMNRKLIWHVNNSDIVSIDVIVIDTLQRRKELSRLKTNKGLVLSQSKLKKPRGNITAGMADPKKLKTRLVRATRRQKRHAKELAVKQKILQTPILSYYIRLTIADRVIAAAQALLLRYHSQYQEARQSNVAKKSPTPIAIPTEPPSSAAGLLSRMSTRSIGENRRFGTALDEDESEDDGAAKSDEEVETDQSDAAKLISAFAEGRPDPMYLERKVSKLISKRGGERSDATIVRKGKPVLTATRLIPCPNNFTALEIFAFLSQQLQIEMNAPKKTFQRIVSELGYARKL